MRENKLSHKDHIQLSRGQVPNPGSGVTPVYCFPAPNTLGSTNQPINSPPGLEVGVLGAGETLKRPGQEVLWDQGWEPDK